MPERTTTRVQEILSWYQSDSPGTLANLHRLLMTGTLAGTGKLVILPVDQGFEHGPARSFAPNPPGYDPEYHFQLAIEAGCNAYAAPLGFIEAGARKYAGQIPLILKLNNSDSLSKLGGAPISALTASVKEAVRLGCAAIGYTIYPASDARNAQFEALRALTVLGVCEMRHGTGTYVSSLEPDLLVHLYEAIDAVVAVKECSGDARRIPALLNAAPGLEVLIGGDDWALEGFCAGATGWVTGVADVAPRECVALYEHCLAGELDAAREVYQRLLPLARFDMTPKLVQYFKAAQDEVGLAGGPCREPRLPLGRGEREDLLAALAVLREGVPA